MPQFTHGHALVIGMGADLPDTIQDATGLADILTDQSRCAYPPGQVTLLTGEKATRAAVLSALDSSPSSTMRKPPWSSIFPGMDTASPPRWASSTT